MSTVATRSKTYTYRTSNEWLGRRNGRTSTPGRESLVVTQPPEFRGEEGFWTPEEMFVASVETCLMLTFASMIERYKLPVEAYYSEAVGTMENANGEYVFTRIDVKATVIMSDREAAPKVLQTMDHAHRDCVIANSIAAQVKVTTELIMAAAE